MNSPDLRIVTILGAGTMGAQISYSCATHGYDVRLVDHTPAALEAARARHQDWATRELTDPADRTAALGRVQTFTELAPALAGADLVIESLPEELGLKQRLFTELDTLCPPGVILASNSSSLRMSRIETGVTHRERVANLHFFQRPSPAIEIMGGSATAPATLERLRQFAASLGLRPFVLRRESTGFLYNRIWRAVKREVLRELAEGVATPDDIDRMVMLTWRWERGPCAWMDIVGLDVVRDIERVYANESGDPREAAPAFLEEMIARGERGAKSGRGFYSYPHPAYEQPGWLWDDLPQPALNGQITVAGLIGAWRLVSFETVSNGAVTYPYGADGCGSLLYSADGRMSVILSRANRPALPTADPLAPVTAEKAAAFESCFAYSGTFTVAPDRVVHRLEQCTFPNWIGTEQVRYARFDGPRLVLETPPMPMGGVDVVSRLVWERAGA